jgi:hypothetical protein
MRHIYDKQTWSLGLKIDMLFRCKSEHISFWVFLVSEERFKYEKNRQFEQRGFQAVDPPRPLEVYEGSRREPLRKKNGSFFGCVAFFGH